MKNRIPSFLAGMFTMLLLSTFTVSALAIAEHMSIEIDPINVQVNGEVFQPKDAGGNDVPVFVYNGTTYAPLRALAEAYGLDVWYDSTSNLAAVGPKGSAPTTPTPTPGPTPTSPTSTNDYVFALSDSDITDAIESGKASFGNVNTFLRSNYSVPYTSVNSNAQLVFTGLASRSTVTILTPYVYIMRNSCMNNMRFKTYSFDDAKSYYEKAESLKAISIELDMEELTFDKGSSFNVGIMQNGAIIDIPAIGGLDGYPRTTSEPYYRTVNLTISQDQIDTSKPIQLVVRFITGDEIIYDIDLSKYK